MEDIFFSSFKSPIGEIVLSCENSRITSIHIQGDRFFKSIPNEWIRDDKEGVLIQGIYQLKRYFSKELEVFDLPIMLDGTDFEMMVWKFLEDIPYGKTVTYGDISKGIGKPRAWRAVGSAVGRNPLSILIPCHRVIKSDGSIGNYAFGVKRKRFLLDLEGVDI